MLTERRPSEQLNALRRLPSGVYLKPAPIELIVVARALVWFAVSAAVVVAALSLVSSAIAGEDAAAQHLCVRWG